MHNGARNWILACALGAAVLPVLASGAVEVSFVAPASYTDAGNNPDGAKANEETLARYLQTHGARYQGDGQVLKVDVLDIDLAGTLRPSRTGFEDLRIARGGADFPRIKVHYSLVEAGKVLDSGDETVSDLNYLRRGAGDYGATDPLRHEKRMLADWFKARFGPHRQAG